MCHQNSCACVSIEEARAAEECLLVFCKPVELYNILLRRAQYNPPFLQRCMRYKIQARKRRRLMNGSVIFNYKDQNDVVRKSEVTREFSCPFCLARCGSFKGLRYHLISFHDLFGFEFWEAEEYRAINVSVKVDAVRLEIIANGFDPRMHSFCFCSKLRKRRSEDPLENAKYVHPQILEPDWTPNTTEGIHKESHERYEGEDVPGSAHNESELPISRIRGEMNCFEMGGRKSGELVSDITNSVGIPVARAHPYEDIECSQTVSLDRRASLSMPSSSKARKVSLDRADSRNGALLHKRTFFHSHRAQPMALEQVLSDWDSEDEVDVITDLTDRRMLDDFVDVSRDEKHLMHLWNSFVRRQRVIADGHVPWAYEAFLRVHGRQLVESPSLLCCWRLFTIKLWNHGLVDGFTINIGGSFLEGLKRRGNAS